MASQDNPKTVELYGYGTQHEGVAASAITPGMLVERTAAGKLAAHSTAGEGGNTHFANEYALTGEGIEDAYAADDQVVFTTYNPGAGVYALVAAGATAIAAGDFLASAGDGTLAGAGLDEVAVAQALDALDNSGGAEVVRLRVEIVPSFTTAAV